MPPSGQYSREETVLLLNIQKRENLFQQIRTPLACTEEAAAIALAFQDAEAEEQSLLVLTYSQAAVHSYITGTIPHKIHSMLGTTLEWHHAIM